MAKKDTATKKTTKTTKKATTASKSTTKKTTTTKTATKPAKEAAPKVAQKTLEKPAKKAAPKKLAQAKKEWKGATLAGQGTGRRKKSIARVWLRKGSGKMTINGRSFEDYFDTEITRLAASTPMRLIDEAQEYDVEANIQGGGLWGQADALKLGIARALVLINEGLRPELRKHGLLTVDARNKERKKPGQPAARRKFQFVKR
jgi:small subunit ribosomal protein S9